MKCELLFHWWLAPWNLNYFIVLCPVVPCCALLCQCLIKRIIKTGGFACAPPIHLVEAYTHCLLQTNHHHLLVANEEEYRYSRNAKHQETQSYGYLSTISLSNSSLLIFYSFLFTVFCLLFTAFCWRKSLIIAFGWILCNPLARVCNPLAPVK